jgi:hypothetical protein
MEDLYDVFPYTLDKLKSILSEISGTSKKVIDKKFICIYFKNYFEDLNATTIIIEKEYIDHDFLEDFAAYYVKCFKQYKKTCARLHFFNTKFTKKDFKNLLSGQESTINETNLNSGYLGFIVVKPLPETVIGRTCLKTYEVDGNGRNYPIKRLYTANLFGIELQVNSIAFQEQDSVVAACATSALWSVFQVSGILYQHPILSPVELTKAACDSLPLESRSLPNKGLTLPQMAHAIQSVNLEPLLINASDEKILKSTIHAYLKGGVPLILTVLLVDTSYSPGILIAKHAIAVTGYNIDEKSAPCTKHDFLLKALRINKIYAHDDQIGPFSRIILDKKKIKINGNEYEHISMATSWKGENNEIGSIRAVAENLLIPVYHKIRIPLSDIQTAIMHFDDFIKELQAANIFPFKQQLEWDIYLTQINKFKKDIYEELSINEELKHEILTEGMPKFLWRAEATCDGEAVLDLIFDATDILQGLSLIRAIGYENKSYEFLKIIAKEDVVVDQYKDKPAWKILKWFHTNS